LGGTIKLGGSCIYLSEVDEELHKFSTFIYIEIINDTGNNSEVNRLQMRVKEASLKMYFIAII
jgi:hypothetical protein